MEHETLREPTWGRERLERFIRQWQYEQETQGDFGQLAADDSTAYDELRACRRRMEETRSYAPTALLRELDIPITQIIASLASKYKTQDWSPQLAPHLQRIYDALIAWIEQAFEDVPFPPTGSPSLYQAEAADNYQACDRSRDHKGRWQDLPQEQLLENEWALPHLGPEGVVYYFPAVMCFALRHGFDTPDRWITESLEYSLAPSSANLRDHQRQRLQLLTQEQRRAIFAYTLALGSEAPMSAWRDATEIEIAAPEEDWFDYFFPP